VVQETANQFYQELVNVGLEPLYDDRSESPGIKFNDADLIGLPLRVTVSQRALEAGGVELKRRDSDIREVVPMAGIIDRLHAELAEMHTVIERSLTREEIR
jgi:prolyl-tRNA synthetase